MRLLLVIFFTLILFLSAKVPNTFAVTTSIISKPETITTEPFSVKITISGAQKGKDNYLRIDLYKEETTNYFGETKNDSEFYGGSDGTKYPSITIQSNETTATITGRVGTPQIKEYDGTGQYFMRVRRYTSATGYNNDEAKASAIAVKINLTSPTTDNSGSISSSTNNTPAPQPTPATVSTTITTIYLSEVYPYPNENEGEWVELYNPTDSVLTISNWFIDDVADGGSKEQQFSLTVPASSYGVIELSKAIFNNDGDEVRLLNTEGKVIDSFSYSEVKPGVSFGRLLPQMTLCFQSVTKGAVNQSCLPQPTDKSTSKAEESTTSSRGSTITITATTNTTTTSINTNKNSRDNFATNSFSEQAPQSLAEKVIPNSRGQVLAVSDFKNDNKPSLVRLFSAASAGFSLTNILFIIYKIAEKIKIN